MRCATCGTENAPDSRFCGGCGAKLAPASRLAPTAKIPDDASYPSQPPQPASIPPQNNYASGPASIPPQNHAHGPASIPPQSHVPASIPPHSHAPASIPPQSHAPASIPPQNNSPAVPGSIPPSNNPASIPPQNSFQRAATPMQTPPPGSLKMPTPAPGSLSFAATPREGDPLPTSQRPPVTATTDASRSFVVPPSRPIGLMVLVLLVDLALAGAGAVLLGKGLSEKKPATKPAQKTQRERAPQEDAPTNVDVPSNAAAASVTAASGAAASDAAANSAGPNVEARASNIETSSGAKVAAAAPKPSQAKAAPKSKAAEAPPPTTPAAPTPAPTPAAPAQPSFDTQLERATANSKPAFDRCALDAGSPHGTVRVAFRVLEDGSVANAFPVEDSTGSPTLGQCLAQTITTWRFTSDPARRAPINSLRAFNYP
jgi:hypothetical protein